MCERADNNCREEKLGCKGCAYYKENIIKEITDYAKWHILHLAETIADYIDDGIKENRTIIGELREEKEYWHDILRIINNEETYIKYKEEM